MLRHALHGLFGDWLAHHYPDRRQRVLGRIRACRDGKLNDPQFGSRMRGQGVYAAQLSALFDAAARKSGLHEPLPPLNTADFRRPPQAREQMKLW